MECCSKVIEEPHAHDHLVQFYKADEPLLNRNVGRYLWEGYLRGDALVVIATAERRESLVSHLARMGGDVAAALSDRQLTVLDAKDTLDTFMVNGWPDQREFEAVLTRTLDRVNPRFHNAKVRAYGEMVGVLWEAGQIDAAVRLEECWNELIRARGISLFCGYPIDVFGADLTSAPLRALVAAHTHLLPSGSGEHMSAAIRRATRELLGFEPEDLAAAAEPAIEWVRRNAPAQATNILERARNYYRESSQACAA